MNCDEISLWLPEYVEQTLSPDTADSIRGHLDDCAACQTALEQLQRLLCAARSLPQLVPSAARVLPISAAIHAEGTPKRRTEFGPVLTMEELADYLRTDQEALQVYLDQIPRFELGGRLLFRRESVEQWLQQRELDFETNVSGSLRHVAVAPQLVGTGGVPWKSRRKN